MRSDTELCGKVGRTLMQAILAVLMVAFTPFTSAQEPTLRLTFSPESEKFAQDTAEYRAIWDGEGTRIVEAMESVSGLKFTEKDISVVVYEGVSLSGFGDRPMKLRASYPPDTKKATLIHELGHRLLIPIRISKTREELDQHRVLFLVLYDIWEKLYGKEFADKQVEVEKERRGAYDYESAWRWALSLSKAERAAQFKELREFTAKSKATP